MDKIFPDKSTLNEIDLKGALRQYFGFDKFKGSQEKIILNLLGGKNTFVIMPTGGGKSLCYQLPSFLLPGTSVIVSPLIALMKNQVDAIRNVTNDESVAHFMNSSLSKNEIQKESDQRKSDLENGNPEKRYGQKSCRNHADQCSHHADRSKGDDQLGRTKRRDEKIAQVARP